jgi:hypothetical protein
MALLRFLKANSFVLYKDDRWYSTDSKWNKVMGVTSYYTDEEIFEFFKQTI